MHSIHAKRQLPGFELTEHYFQVPEGHAAPAGGEEIAIFGREVVATEHVGKDLPWMVFLQGGPGHPSPRPMERGGWIGRVIEDYRLLLLDQRGTGLSTPVTGQTMAAAASDARGLADRLKLFRSDAIVADCELIRRELCGDEPWTVLGQSYGGFCLAHYLSAAPEGLAGGLFTGGLPPLVDSVDDVYRATYPIVMERNRLYYERYPDDRNLVRRIAAHLEEHDVRLPSGDRLTTRRLQSLGLNLGFSDGAEILHYLFEQAFAGAEISRTFLKGFESAQTFDTNPIFLALHEACYTQGFASRWSAERVRAEFPAFDDPGDGPLHFTGEMIYPWMFDEIGALAPLREAAHLLAEDDDWPVLYDREVLARNEVPCAAAIYTGDMYVEREFSEETARRIRGLKPWITSEYEHNGLRSNGPHVVGHLLDLMRGRA
jgi:pimeloyl-ACP methyl ester carboxylesterase